MHPFIPFVTEEIYGKINTQEGCLSSAGWPKQQKELIDIKASSQMQIIIDVISAIRNIRAQWNVKPNEEVDVFIIPMDSVLLEFLKINSADIQRLGRLKNLNISLETPNTQDCATALVGQIKIFVPLKGAVDLSLEKKRMMDEMTQKQKLIANLKSRLNNDAFTSKAPQEIIIKEKERLGLLTKEVNELKNVLANLS